MPAIEPAEVQDLLGRWWFNYDEGNFDALRDLLTDDAHFTCRTDTGTTEYEEFVRADYTGRAQVMDWQTEHRRHSPYPLRHNGTNVHLVERSAGAASFASYIDVTHITASGLTPLSSAVVRGHVRATESGLRISAMHVVLDTMVSVPLLTVRGR